MIKDSFLRELKVVRTGLAAAAITIGGCAQVAQVVEDPRLAFISASDPCAPSREPFVAIREEQRKQIAKWTALGALAGATAVVLSTDVNRDKLILGTLGGALAGAVTGYYRNLNKRGSETADLRSAIFTDAKSDASGGDELVTGVSNLNACRMKSLDDIAIQLQSGLITKEEARTNLALVKSQTQKDNKLIESVSEGLAKRSSIYVTALRLSGADDAEKYIAEAEAYEPIVQKPQYTISRGASQSGTVTFSEAPLVESKDQKSVSQVTQSEVEDFSDRPAPAPITITKRPKVDDNSVTDLAKGSAELDAMVVAHIESVDEAIENIEAVLL